jgi:8-oxo-dGTP diphosphatase
MSAPAARPRKRLGSRLDDDDLHCFGYISEKSYEGAGHWLMFLFECKKAINALPNEINEGHFEFFERAAIDELPIPETDRTLLWPYYDQYREGFIGLRANCNPSGLLEITEELKI